MSQKNEPISIHVEMAPSAICRSSLKRNGMFLDLANPAPNIKETY